MTNRDSDTTEFSRRLVKGSRVGFSQVGRNHVKPIKPNRQGTVSSETCNNDDYVYIIWDGTKTVRRYAAQFLEPILEGKTNDAR